MSEESTTPIVRFAVERKVTMGMAVLAPRVQAYAPANRHLWRRAMPMIRRITFMRCLRGAPWIIAGGIRIPAARRYATTSYSTTPARGYSKSDGDMIPKKPFMCWPVLG